MKTEIVSNLVWIAIWAILGITALIAAISYIFWCLLAFLYCWCVPPFCGRSLE